MVDRTAEFRSLVAQLPKPPVAAAPPPQAKSQAAQTAQFVAAFHQSAAIVSRKIHDTSGKLAQLSRLIKRKSLFDDPAEEINGLMYTIKEDIQTLNGLLDSTQRDVDDFKYRQGKDNQLASHSSHVVGTLRTDLADATKTFKDLLQQRSTNVKEQFDRRGQYGIRTNDALALGKPTVYRPLASTAALDGSAKGAGGGGGFGGAAPGGAAAGMTPGGGMGLPRPQGVEVPAPPPGGFQMTGYQQQQLLIPEQEYLEARAQAIEDVESHIVELGQIFNRLATMIAEQRELVERIEDNVDDAHERISRTRDYLMGVYANLSSNRPLLYKTAAILLFFIVFFVVFMA